MVSKKKESLIQFNKTNILNAAKKLFMEKGIVKTTMDDIAKESEYSKSTIYVYFKSKDEIYNNIVYEYMVMLKEAVLKITDESDDFEEGFYLMCNTMVSFQEDYPLYFESILSNIKIDGFDDEPILGEIYKVGEEVNKIIEEFFKAGIDKKSIRSNIKLMPTVFTLLGSICGLISMSYKKADYIKKDMNMDKKEFLQYGFQTLLNSILVIPK